MPRFVILEHDAPADYRGLHWDFMLEMGDVLRTWALGTLPDEIRSNVAFRLAAELLNDHRLAYLEQEGPLSGGRGTVKRWDQGTYELVAERSTTGGQQSSIVADVVGAKVRGRVELVTTLDGRQSNEKGKERTQRWWFSFTPGTNATGLKAGSHVGEPSELPRVVRPAT